VNKARKEVCLYFQAHQPFRARSYDFFQIGSDSNYFDDAESRRILNEVCEGSYLPALELFEKLYQGTKGNFSIGLGLSGTLITQLLRWRPDVLGRFQQLVASGIIELTGGMMTHSIASFFSAQEASRQMQNHRQLIKEHFGVRPTTFANTELIYRDDMVKMIQSFGYDTILVEGVERYLGHRSPDYLYHAVENPEVRLLVRNGSLSDDLSLRFSDQSWNEFPLTAEKYLSWLMSGSGLIKNLFFDMESIGCRHQPESGVFAFWENLVMQSQAENVVFQSPTAVATSTEACEAYSSPKHSSWASASKDKSAWQANVMQQEASQKLFRLQQLVESSNSPELYDKWSYLQSADHFITMSTNGDLEVGDPYQNYSYFMNILADLQMRVKYKMAEHILSKTSALS